MKRQLNYKFIAILMVVTAFFGAGVHFLHAFQVRRNAHSLLGAAERAEEKRELNQAVMYYSRYLGFEPADLSAKAKFGIALDELGQQTKNAKTRLSAYFVMEQVLLGEPKRSDLRLRCVEIGMTLLARFDEARQHLEFLSDESRQKLKILRDENPKEPELKSKAELENLAEFEFKQALCAVGQKKFIEAAKLLGEATDNAPTELKYYLELAALQEKNSDKRAHEEARETLKKMAERNADNYRAHLARASFLIPLPREKDLTKDEALKDAEKALVEARRLAPEDADVLLMSAALAEQKDDPAQARQFLRSGLSTHPKNAALRMALIFLEIRQKEIDKALEEAESAHKTLPEHNDIAIVLADLLMEKDQIARAETILTGLAKTDADKNVIGYLQARMHIQRSEWSKAEPILTRVRPFVANKNLLGKVDFMVGLCYERLGNPNQALLVYQEAVKNDPLNKATRLKVASALGALDRLEDSIREYQQLQALGGAPAGVDLALARAFLQKNLRLPKEKRRWDETKSYLRRAENNLPEAAEVTILKAEIMFQEGDENQARALLTKVRDAKPERLEYWLALASLAGRQDPEKALAVLEEAGKQLNPENRVDFLLGKMNFLTRLPRAEAHKAIAQLDKDLTTNKEKDEKAQERLQSGLAMAYFKVQLPKDAAQLWELVAKAQPQNLGLRLILCDLALNNNEEAEADRWLQEIHNIEGEIGSYWRYGQAFRLFKQTKPKDKEPLSPEDRHRLSQARTLLNQLYKIRPSWHVVPALEGQIDDLEGRTERAIENMQRAIMLGERRAGIIRRAVELLIDRKRYGDAENAILKLIDQDQEQTLLAAGLGKLAAQSLLFNNKMDDAMRLARESVRSDSDDYKDHLWLSQILWTSDQKADAKNEIALACKYGPTAPETWETYVYYLTQMKENKEAEAVLAQAKKSLPADKRALSLAHGYAMLGNNPEAEKQFLIAQSARPSDKTLRMELAGFYFRTGQNDRAETVYRDILSGWDSMPEQKALARRLVATIWASKKNYRDFNKALALIEENRNDSVDSRADQRTKAIIMAQHVTRQREAIGLLEELNRNQTLSLEDRLLLVKLYDDTNNKEKFKIAMTTLLASREGKKSENYAYYARRLLSFGEITEAGIRLSQLEDLAPGSSLAKEIKARVLHAQGKEEEAAKELQDLAANEVNIPFAAMILEELDKSAKTKVYFGVAEQLYQQYVAKNPSPNSTLIMARFLGRHKRITEALDYCEKLLSMEIREVVLSTAVGALRVSPSAKDQFARVEPWLKRAQKENPTISLMELLADFYDLQGNYYESMAIYRKILEKNEEDLLALNNLAWLLALQGKGAEALVHINKAMGITGPVPEILDTRGVIYISLDKKREARDDLAAAVKMSASGYTFFHLACVQSRAKDLGNWQESFRRAKAAGITVDTVHPLERQEYQRLAAELDRKGT